jgi:hypothetical protein
MLDGPDSTETLYRTTSAKPVVNILAGVEEGAQMSFVDLGSVANHRLQRRERAGASPFRNLVDENPTTVIEIALSDTHD